MSYHDDDNDYDQIVMSFSCHVSRSPVSFFKNTEVRRQNIEWELQGFNRIFFQIYSNIRLIYHKNCNFALH